jgi:L-iditol 2-dehydrogenase
MKALKYSGPWQLAVEEMPEPIMGPDDVLIRSEAVGICGSDVHGYTGESGRRKAGMVMGHEAAGTVISTGANVGNLKEGDEVAVFPTLGCGKCRYCLAGNEHICPDKRILGVNSGTWGAMAEFFTCNARQAVPLSEKVDPAIALLAEPLAVALHAINRMQPEKDAILAIVGAGTIGLALTVVLKGLGHQNIFILDKIDEKLAFAKELGAEPINIDREDALKFINAKTGGRRAAGVFEAVGTAGTVKAAFELADFGGTVILIGNLAKEFSLPLQGVTSNETTLRGSYGFNRKEFAAAVRIAQENQNMLAKFITGSCSLEEAPQVMEELAKGTRQAMKIVIRPRQKAARVHA